MTVQWKIFGFVFTLYLLLLILFSSKKYLNMKKGQTKLAFFHPFCNDSGGGQKVLWCMIEGLLNKQQYSDRTIPSSIEVAIYSLEPQFSVIAQKAKNRFNVDINKYADRIKIIYVPGRNLLVPKSRLTMIFHIILPMIYCLKCLWKYQPDIYYDTTGFVYTFLAVKLMFIPKTLCYTYIHYPFISSDMIHKIEERRSDFNNDSEISKSPFKTKIKLFYYRIILISYKMMKLFSDRTQTNSTWTDQHMIELWGHNKTVKLYPPCSISELLNYPKSYEANNIISLAQFRPEKNHKLQIRVLRSIIEELTKSNQQQLASSIHLYICGSTRGEADEELLQGLKSYACEQKMEKFVTFCVNMKFPDLMRKFKECQLGIHSMQAEHFGISIVQMLASGCIVVAHNSAGPKYDIIKDKQYLAESEEEYHEKLLKLIRKSKEQKKQTSDNFRKQMEGFGEKNFRENFRSIFHQNSYDKKSD